ncbi:unnamed protein product, partial [Chrysoparadoxa australica]
LSEEDRQCAWELYTEIITRLAIHGRSNGTSDLLSQFEGEIYIESLNSMYSFFCEMRGIMRKFPVGKIEKADEYHLGKFTCSIMNDVLRPFLEKWQGKYRHWYSIEEKKKPGDSPFEIQSKFPELNEFLTDWFNVRYVMKETANTLAKEYKLIQNIE